MSDDTNHTPQLQSAHTHTYIQPHACTINNTHTISTYIVFMCKNCTKQAVKLSGVLEANKYLVATSIRHCHADIKNLVMLWIGNKNLQQQKLATWLVDKVKDTVVI